MSDTPQDLALMQILNLIATIPSLMATVWMIYFCFKGLSANTPMKLILTLAISDFIYAVVNLMALLQSTTGSMLCDTEAIFRNLSSNFSVCIAASIALLHYHILKMDPDFNKIRFVTYCIVISALASVAFALRYAIIHHFLNFNSPFYAGDIVMYSKVGIMCNIIDATSASNYKAFIIIFTKCIFAVVAGLISLISYLKTIRLIRKIDRLLLSKKLNIQKLLWYPATIFMIFLPNLIYYILTFCFGLKNSLFWGGATMLITHSLGTINAITYGIQRKVHKDVKRISAVDIEIQRDRLETTDWGSTKERMNTVEL